MYEVFAYASVTLVRRKLLVSHFEYQMSHKYDLKDFNLDLEIILDDLSDEGVRGVGVIYHEKKRKITILDEKQRVVDYLEKSFSQTSLPNFYF